MTRYRLSPAAERDLGEILDYTVQKWGLGQAVRYMEKLESAFEVLAASPGAGLRGGTKAPESWGASRNAPLR